eukprot:scaffold91132_cov32-Tisochrysis_lutea.AAC.2
MEHSVRALVVFDLDACCWSPEMFELWGGGAPFKVVRDVPGDMTLADARGVKVSNQPHRLNSSHPGRGAHALPGAMYATDRATLNDLI